MRKEGGGGEKRGGGERVGDKMRGGEEGEGIFRNLWI